MKKEIKIYKPLVWCRLKATYNHEPEILNWEGTVDAFKAAMVKYDYIQFNLYGMRHVPVRNIDEFNAVQDEEVLSLEMMISGLTELQKKSVRDRIKQYRSNLWRSPSDEAIASIILFIVHGRKEEEYTPLSRQKRIKVILRIQKNKVAKIVFGDYFFFQK